MSLFLTIAICTRNRPTQLRRCLASLQAQLDEQSEVLVIDSAPSSSATQAIAQAFGVHYLAISRPGLNVARNMALRAARGAIIAFIDDDAVAAPGWIEALLTSFTDPSISFATGRVMPLELRTLAQRHFEEHFSFDRGPEPFRFTANDHRPWFPIYPSHLGTGCNMAFRREVFDVVGPFDEALDTGTPTGGGGDIDMFRRLLRAGFVAAYNPATLVYHEHRVDEAESRAQFWAYGKAFTALLTKSILIEHDRVNEAVHLVAYRFWQQGRWLARRLLKRRGLPSHLILIETLGHLVGPVALLRSLRHVQLERLHHLHPVQVQILEVEGGLPPALEVEPNHDLYLLINQVGRPQGSVLIEAPGPTIVQERLVRVVETLERQPQPLTNISAHHISIIVCTRDRPELLRSCLESLSKLQGALHEVIVVDNGSGFETAQVAHNYPVRLVREERPGLCRARNRGLAEARGDIVAFIDDDVSVDTGWLAALAAGFADPMIAGVIGLVLPRELRTPAQRIFESTGGLGRGFNRRVYHRSLPATPLGDIGVGANMAFRRTVVLKHGPFHEALDVGTPTQAGGDIDMFYRVLKGGETILYEPAMLVWHRHREQTTDLRLLRYRYSMGASAAFTRWIIRGDLAALRLSLMWFANHHLRELVASLLGLHLLPPEIVVVGLWAALLGPLAYMRSRWQARQREPIQITPQEKVDNWLGEPTLSTTLLVGRNCSE
jgi:glycosyltransferase involved in cell wall biosynthesis